MISYVLPTRDRPERLKATLMALSALGDHGACGGAEVIVVDNASREPALLPRELPSGVPVKALYLARNEGAAARNEGARAADPAAAWIVMLDDDSYPDDLGFVEALAGMPADVGAVSADIWLERRSGPDTRESGGLPEVFIGCGVALRRDLFLSLGGYDPIFNYYAEEYDLAARILMVGGRVRFEPSFSVTHAKVSQHRDMNTILGRLVRNNGWVAQRYAPESERLEELRETRRRYRRIAQKEQALAGFGQGLAELRRTLRAQARTPMSLGLWERFVGLTAAREAVLRAQRQVPFRTAAVIEPGKNARVVAMALEEIGVRVVAEGEDAEVQVIGTMSPGPMLDAYARRAPMARTRGLPIIMPWIVPGLEAEQKQRERVAAVA